MGLNIPEYDGVQLVLAIQEELDRMDSLTETMREEGFLMDEAERAYRVEKRKRLLYEKARGTAVGIIQDVVKGYEDIADLKRASDDAEHAYWTTKQAIENAQQRIDFMRDLMRYERRGE